MRLLTDSTVHERIGENICSHAAVLRRCSSTELGRRSQAAVMCAAVGLSNTDVSCAAYGQALGLDNTSEKAYAEQRDRAEISAHMAPIEALKAELYYFSERKERSDKGFDKQMEEEDCISPAS